MLLAYILHSDHGRLDPPRIATGLLPSHAIAVIAAAIAARGLQAANGLTTALNTIAIVLLVTNFESSRARQHG
jgi:hypothetical protein